MDKNKSLAKGKSSCSFAYISFLINVNSIAIVIQKPRKTAQSVVPMWQ